MGDNVHSDYNIPKSLGLNAERCLHGYNYYQNERCEMEHTSGVFDSYYCASFSRSIILKYAPNPAVSFASDFIAPIYVPFVYSIFLDAEKRGIKSLYFCARDGLILYNIAKEIQHFFSNIDIHYLYVSRASLYFPGLPDVSFDTLKSLLNTTPSFSLDVFLELLNMEDYSYDKSEIDKFSVREDVLSYLYHQQEFKSLLQKRHKEHRMLCLEYFKQEGMLEKPCAIVDLTGTRRCQNAMNNILHSCGSSVFGYYFEVLNHRYNGMDYMAEYFADRYTWNIHNCRIEPHDIFEQYFSISNHNRTVSYRKAYGRIEPLFSQYRAAA